MALFIGALALVVLWCAMGLAIALLLGRLTGGDDDDQVDEPRVRGPVETRPPHGDDLERLTRR